MESTSLRKTFCNRIISPTLRRMSSGCFETLERGQRRCSTRPLAPWPFVVALHGVAWPLSPKTHENVQLKKVERATPQQPRLGPLRFFRKTPSGLKVCQIRAEAETSPETPWTTTTSIQIKGVSMIKSESEKDQIRWTQTSFASGSTQTTSSAM
jgi:hypothetical protein